MLKNRERTKESLIRGSPVTLTPNVPSLYVPLERGTPVQVPGQVDIIDTWFEAIRSDDESPRNRWKDVEHYKLYFDPNDVSPLTYPRFSVDSATNYSWSGDADTKELVLLFPGYAHPSSDAHVLYNVREDGGFIDPPPYIDDLITRSLNAMLPGIKAELSLVNSVIELKDFVSLPHTIERIEKFLVTTTGHKFFRLPTRLARVRRSFGKNSGRTLREALGASSDAYLQLEFNIGPLLQDITGIFQAVSSLEKVIRDLLIRAGRVQRRHFTYKWLPGLVPAVSSTSIVQWYDTNYVNNGFVNVPYGGIPGSTLYSSYQEFPATFHAEIEYNYSLSQFQVEHARLLGFLDLLGVNLNPQIIWNAIPWSFVVDWVVGIGSILNNFAVRNLEPKTNITKYLWSWKYNRTRKRSIQSYATWPNMVPLSARNLPHTYESIYRRQVGIPANNSVILSGLSSKELSLGAALVFSRKPRYNRG